MLSPEVQPGELTDLDRFIFESWGYFVIPGVLTQPEIDECLEASRRLHEKAGSSTFARVGRGYETEPARSLMGEFGRPDAPYGANYPAPDFDGSGLEES